MYICIQLIEVDDVNLQNVQELVHATTGTGTVPGPNASVSFPTFEGSNFKCLEHRSKTETSTSGFYEGGLSTVSAQVTSQED